MKLYIATSDKTSRILTPFCWLMDKYAAELDVAILGYGKWPDLPSRFERVSLAPEQKTPDEWCRRLYDYFLALPDRHILFGLDDFLPTRPIDYGVFGRMEKWVGDRGAARYELGPSHTWHTEKRIAQDFGDFAVYEYGQNTPYRISTQYSLWRRDYFVNALRQCYGPWSFEVRGSDLANHDGEAIVATTGKTAWSWVEAGAISGRHPDKVNIAGLDREVVEEMIRLGFWSASELQYGMAEGWNKPYEVKP